MRVAEIPDSWKTLPLYPSSVPHFLHWDLALLWVLKKAPVYRPDSWGARVEGWRRLLFLFAGGRLQIATDPIQLPMRDFTAPYGITEVGRLELKDGDEWRTVGVLSPTTIVRPLPDATDEQLLRLPQFPADRPAVHVVLSLIRDRIVRLLETKHATSHALEEDLRKILDREIAAITERATSHYGFRSVPCRLLRTIRFQRSGDHPDLDSVDVQIVDRAVQPEPKYVPRCENAGCKELLTRGADDAPIDVSGEEVELTCPHGHTTGVPLKEFFIWRRPRPEQRPEYVVWDDRSGAFAAPEPAPRWPPEAKVLSGRLLQFEWNPGALGGESFRTVLKLHFTDGDLRRVSVQKSCFYEQLLVPQGDTAGFRGVPVRWEWRDAWRQADACDSKADQIQFTGVEISGIPFRFSKSYSVTLKKEKDLAVGVYPPPMHLNWRTYRAAVVGAGAKGYRIEAGGERVLPFAEDTAGWPGWVAVESEDGRAGVCYWLRAFTPKRVDTEVGAVRLGVDFGTSNTVIYFRRHGEENLSTERNAVQPLKFRELVYWLHRHPAADFDAGWFLPSGQMAGRDRCLIPSALWIPMNGLPVVRWAAPPAVGCESAHGFKWDEQLQNRHGLRLRYLREVFLYGVPHILQALGNTQARPVLDVGYSYPLAFDYEQRMAHRRLIEEAGAALREISGHNVKTLSVNESLAAVRALGAPNPGTLYLVGDMGGRTLDVALFACPATPSAAALANCIYQIGSLDFGGEQLLYRLSAKHAGASSGRAYLEAYWDLREKVQSGAGTKAFAGDAALEESLNRLQTLALEYLRTMAAAFRRRAQEPAREIRILLIGNGWRLRDLCAAGLDPEYHFKDYSECMVHRMADVCLRVWDATLPGTSSSKHLVAIGALKAADDQSQELEGQPYRTELPAGRGFKIEGDAYDWAASTGQGSSPLSNPGKAKSGTIDFNLDDSPAPSGEWRDTLESVRPQPGWYPSQDLLREWLKQNIRHDRVQKGPLQLILEKYWRENL